jgi:nucleoside-diphosphate-sugar epimerase
VLLFRSTTRRPATSFESVEIGDPVTTASAARADALLLLGGLFIATHSPGDASALIDANVLGPMALADSFLASGTRGLVLAGTSWQSVAPDSEPSNPYAASRQAAWTILKALSASYGVSAVCLRVADTYGRGDTRGKLMSLLRRAAISGTLLPMSPGEQIVDPAYAPDVANAFVTACEVAQSGGSGGEWSVAGGEPMRLRDKVRKFEQAVGREVPVLWGARPYRVGEPLEPILLARPSWWTSTVTFAEGIQLTESEPGGLLDRSGAAR